MLVVRCEVGSWCRFQLGSEMTDPALAKSSELLSRVEAGVSSEDLKSLIRKEQASNHDQ